MFLQLTKLSIKTLIAKYWTGFYCCYGAIYAVKGVV